MFDEESATPNTTGATAQPSSISADEYRQFRAWQDNKIRQQALAEGRSQASAEQQAAEAEADRAALAQLTSKGLNLKDAFGRTSTARGRNTLAVLYQRGVGGSQRGVYGRLRRMAAAEGLVQ